MSYFEDIQEYYKKVTSLRAITKVILKLLLGELIHHKNRGPDH